MESVARSLLAFLPNTVSASRLRGWFFVLALNVKDVDRFLERTKIRLAVFYVKAVTSVSFHKHVALFNSNVFA